MQSFLRPHCVQSAIVISKNLKASKWTSAIGNFFKQKDPKAKGPDVKFGQYEIVHPGNVGPLRQVPLSIKVPDYIITGHHGPNRPGIDLKAEGDLDRMRRAGELARGALDMIKSYIKPGITTDEIDRLVHEFALRNEAYPSPLNYRGFPKSCCTSVNNVACHGIPDDRPLVDGDVVSVDVTMYVGGYHGDCCESFLVGEVDDIGRKLVEVARSCRDTAIASCGPGVLLSKIGEIVEQVSDKEGFCVLPAFAGHGIGTYFHGPPEILHFRNDSQQLMKEGMTFTVEPVIGQGGEHITILDDGWTAVTLDDSRAAQFEHTIAITPHGAEILTPY